MPKSNKEAKQIEKIKFMISFETWSASLRQIKRVCPSKIELKSTSDTELVEFNPNI